MYHIYVKVPGKYDYITCKRGYLFFFLDNTGFARRVDNKELCYKFTMGYKYKGPAIKMADELNRRGILQYKIEATILEDIELALIFAERKLRII